MPASLELVRIALQAYGNGDCEIALALAGPLIRWDERASRPDGDLVWRKEDVQRGMRRYLDGWEEYSFELEDIAEVGPGKVVGICRERGKPKDGTAVDRRFGGLWIVDEGKITAWATYPTPREAVRAAKEMQGGRVQSEQVKRVAAPVEAKPPKPVAAPVQPAPEPVKAAVPDPEEPQVPQRPRKRALTKSEEQKRAARARARLRKQSSRQSA